MGISLPIKVGAVGCGAALEQLYLRPLRRLEKRGWLKVEVLVEPSERRRSWAAKAFPGTRIEADAKRAFEGRAIDLAILTSPPPFHGEHAKSAFESGAHVLSEKPLADKVVAGEQMLEHARLANRLLAVGMTRRFYPCLAQARQLLSSGKLGRVLKYSYREGGVYAWPITSTAPFRRETSGGGVLLDKGVHVLDFLYWLFGPGEIHENQDDSLRGGVEGNSVVKLRHGTVEGLMQLSWDQDLNSGFTISCENGEITMPIGPLHDLYLRRLGESWNRVPVEVNWASDMEAKGGSRGHPRIYYECIDFQLIQVLRAILHGESVPVSGSDGLIVLKSIERAYEIATPMAQNWLPPAEQDFARRNHWKVGS